MLELPALPVAEPSKALGLLRRPFSPEALKFKVQAQFPKDNPKAGLIVAYVDARLVSERLNLVCGLQWSAQYAKDPTLDLFWCALTVFDVTRLDVGEGSYEKWAGKGIVSDALKRAAVHFGVGTSLYALPQQKLWATDSKNPGANELRRGKDERGKVVLRLTETNESWLRDQYGWWLKNKGVQGYGEPLDHGDSPGAVGDIEADPDTAEVIASKDPGPDQTKPVADLPEYAVAMDDERIAQAAKLVQGIPSEVLSPGQFSSYLQTARSTDEKMDRFLGYLSQLTEQVPSA